MCLVIIVLIILSCVIVPFVTPFESREQHLGEANKGMFTVCTDSRYEARTRCTSLAPTTWAATCSSALRGRPGLPDDCLLRRVCQPDHRHDLRRHLRLLRRLVDNIIMRVVDVFYCIPSMPVIIIIGAAMDAMRVDSWKRMMYLMLILASSAGRALPRLVRGQILSLREPGVHAGHRACGIKVRLPHLPPI